MPDLRFHDSATVRAGALTGDLRSRIVGLAESLRGPSWCAILLEDGGAVLAGEDARIEAPVLAWRPWQETSRLRFDAGAVGTYVLLSASALGNTIGHLPEARDLRDVADHKLTVPLSAGSETRFALRTAFGGIRRELEEDAVAAHVVVEAYLRVILIELLRAAPSYSGGPQGASPSHRSFTRFSTLVERHFRDRWSVSLYAETLGLTRDRLGDMCRRVRGLGPKDIIDRRVMIEARLLLETSGRSVNEIATALGFGSAAQFSRYFVRHAGQPPGSYRVAFLKGLEAGVSDPARPFDWP
ncbi:helix-turn-helix domain-containing protein [Marivita sp.]|uniref:AraC family transcriptional regulator n=1 Tax=Marivita sp. TaxID=2003365 RepID=UPI003F6AB53B